MSVLMIEKLVDGTLAAMVDEAVDAVLTPTIETPERAAAQAVLDSPRATRRQREAAWMVLRPVRLRGIEKELPPLVADFYKNLATLSKTRSAGLSRNQVKMLWIGYRAGRLDEQRVAAAVKDGSREDFSGDGETDPETQEAADDE